MVMRKEEPDSQAGLVPAPLSKANPPYPTTPLDEHPPTVPTPSGTPYSPDLNKSPAFNFKTLEEAKQQQHGKKEEDSDYSDDEWDQSEDDDDFERVDPKDVPDSLKPAGGKTPVKNALPDALRAGPPPGVPIKRSTENISPMPTGASSTSVGAMSSVSDQSNGSQSLQTNNPYLKIQPTGSSNWGGETSQQIWGDTHGHAASYDEPVELPAQQTPSTPSHEMANLGLDSNVPPLPVSKSPAQPPLIAVNSPTPLTSPQAEQTPPDSLSNPWNQEASTTLPTAPPVTHPPQQGSLPLEDIPSAHAAKAETGQQPNGDTVHNVAPQAPSTNPFGVPPPPVAAPPLVPGSQPRVPSAIYEDEQPPALPPRRPQEEFPPAMPPRPLNTNVGPSIAAGPESPNTRMNRQRKEHYQIKHIRWHDVNKPGIRTSPILTQNLNGPCPLLALVNALVLSTPADVDSGLVETLRTRETVSLGLLLDAVFEELMSGRRGTAAQDLPDVGDLYKFLLALHTGLNVNPMFVPDSEATNGQLSLTNGPTGQAGGFENTQDMKLYRTFNIPLMHGWLPDPSSEAAAAFNRVAKSYETSQYVQFQEEELDAKLQAGESLNTEEQQMFTDIHAIKEFLSRWPTQLTDHGLQVLKNSFPSGQVAILFRNDHFSTLFKDPRTDKLLTLVTDQGYSSHDEIVWESLVDVHGRGSELFSGDFRPVGNHSSAHQQQPVQSQMDDDGQGWTTVESRRGNQQRTSSTQPPTQEAVSSPTELSRAEQEDHDLALALQLQEEEEDRQRRETAQRERDNAASVQTISAESNARPPNRRTSRGENPPVIPPRRNNITGHRPVNEPAPPPTYEEASTSQPYHPPQGHPANPQAPIPQPGQGSAYMANSAGRPLPARPGVPMMQGRPGGPPPGVGVGGRPGRRYSSGYPEEQREKCIIM